MPRLLALLAAVLAGLLARAMILIDVVLLLLGRTASWCHLRRPR